MRTETLLLEHWEEVSRPLAFHPLTQSGNDGRGGVRGEGGVVESIGSEDADRKVRRLKLGEVNQPGHLCAFG